MYLPTFGLGFHMPLLLEEKSAHVGHIMTPRCNDILRFYKRSMKDTVLEISCLVGAFRPTLSSFHVCACVSKQCLISLLTIVDALLDVAMISRVLVLFQSGILCIGTSLDLRRWNRRSKPLHQQLQRPSFNCEVMVTVTTVTVQNRRPSTRVEAYAG